MVVDLLVWLVVGAIAGWLAGLIVRGYGFGLIGNIIVGIVGAVIAGWLLPRVGISDRQWLRRLDHQFAYRRGDPVAHHRPDRALIGIEGALQPRQLPGNCRNGEDIVVGIESIIVMIVVGAFAGWRKDRARVRIRTAEHHPSASSVPLSVFGCCGSWGSCRSLASWGRSSMQPLVPCILLFIVGLIRR